MWLSTTRASPKKSWPHSFASKTSRLKTRPGRSTNVCSSPNSRTVSSSGRPARNTSMRSGSSSSSRYFLCSFSGPAEDRADFLQQNRHGKGLCRIIVNFQLKSPQLLLFAVEGRKHDNGHCGFPADQLAHAEAIDLWKHDIQQNQVKPLFPEAFDPFHTIAGQHRGIARAPEIRLQKFLNIRLILDYQNFSQYNYPEFECIIKL